MRGSGTEAGSGTWPPPPKGTPPKALPAAALQSSAARWITIQGRPSLCRPARPPAPQPPQPRLRCPPDLRHRPRRLPLPRLMSLWTAPGSASTPVACGSKTFQKTFANVPLCQTTTHARLTRQVDAWLQCVMQQQLQMAWFAASDCSRLAHALVEEAGSTWYRLMGMAVAWRVSFWPPASPPVAGNDRGPDVKAQSS